MATRVISYAPEVKILKEEAIKTAVEAMGRTAVGLVVKQMESGYGKPIRDTGALMADVQFDFSSDSSVVVGNSLDYGKYVHEGTSKMAGRPYITDALQGGRDELAKVVKEILE